MIMLHSILEWTSHYLSNDPVTMAHSKILILYHDPVSYICVHVYVYVYLYININLYLYVYKLIS